MFNFEIMKNEKPKSNYCRIIIKNIRILQFMFTIGFLQTFLYRKRGKCKQNFTIKFFKTP